LVGVIARQGADPVRAEELFFVQHRGQYAAKLVFVEDGSKVAAAHV
jgi:hypothetical protein